MNDPIVEEVRIARMEHTKRFNYDLNAICGDLRKIQKECGHKIVRLHPKMSASTRQAQPVQ